MDQIKLADAGTTIRVGTEYTRRIGIHSFFCQFYIIYMNGYIIKVFGKIVPYLRKQKSSHIDPIFLKIRIRIAKLQSYINLHYEFCADTILANPDSHIVNNVK